MLYLSKNDFVLEKYNYYQTTDEYIWVNEEGFLKDIVDDINMKKSPGYDQIIFDY